MIGGALATLAGLALFARGFFLTRHELGIESTCSVVDLLDAELEADRFPRLSQLREHDAFSECWDEPRYRRIVLVIIDAMRFDFAFGDSVGVPEWYRGKMPTMRETLRDQPENAALFRLVADPPTVTMQRLKGLTTGALPTFIDFRNNFESPGVQEDNFLGQLRARDDGRYAVFMGDDTWDSLYPEAFERSYPYPSFNARDLHTVDDGVLRHLWPELQRGGSPDAENSEESCALLIAHFLGVDHVGHTFGPRSPAMTAKLQEMDAAVARVLEDSRFDDLVLVFGDHGMTEDGNHGGGTEEETTSALFAYSKGGLFPGDSFSRLPYLRWDREHGIVESRGPGLADTAATSFRDIAQVDLVPTISLLLGNPIPFASLGGLIPELFLRPRGKGAAAGHPRTGHEDVAEDLARALLVNSLQVWRYLTAYQAAATGTISEDDMETLQGLLRQALEDHEDALERARAREGPADLEGVAEACLGYRRFLDAVLQIARSAWTEFDTRSMTLGALIQSVTALAMLVAAVARRGVSPSGALALVLLAMWMLSAFSNSFIVDESSVSRYILLSTACIMGVGISRSASASGESVAWRRAFDGLVLVATIRFATEVSGHGQDPVKHLSWIGTPAAAGCLTWIRWASGKRYARNRQQARENTCWSAIFGILAAAAVAYWASEALLPPSEDRAGLRRLFHLWLPRAILLGHALLGIVGSMWRALRSRRTAPLFAAVYHWIALIAFTEGPPGFISGCLFCVAMEVLCRWAEDRRKRASTAPSSEVLQALALFSLGRFFFFATGHASQFSSLQYDVAFIGSDAFYAPVAGAILGMNTLGLDIALLLRCTLSSSQHRSTRSDPSALPLLVAMHCVRAAAATCCAGILRRHLMVWAVFAPKFVFDNVLMAAVLVFGASFSYAFASLHGSSVAKALL